MSRSTPETLARPFLGGPSGSYLASAGPRLGTISGFLAMCALALSSLIGVLLQAPCLARGWELPFASFRMCASPLANAVTGATFPAAPGRAPGEAAEFSPVTSWVVDLGRWMGAGADPSGTVSFMMIILLVNVFAVACGGTALVMLARDRAWVPVAFLSPVIVFSMGQSLDPVGVALALWGLVLLRSDTPLPRSPIAAGALLAVAAFFNPLAIVLLLAVIVTGRSGRESQSTAAGGTESGHPADGTVSGRMSTTDLMALAGASTVTAGVLVLIDGRLFSRLAVWWTQAIDRGSIVSLLSFEPRLDAGLLTLVTVLAWAAALLIAGVLFALSANPLSLPAVATVLLGLSLFFMPAAPTWAALWLVPFAALAVQHIWLQVAWGLSEAALAVAINLSDVTAIEAAEGLSPMWLSIFTLLRLFALAFLVFFALERLSAPAQRPVRPVAHGDL